MRAAIKHPQRGDANRNQPDVRADAPKKIWRYRKAAEAAKGRREIFSKNPGIHE
jgi:hypothetical protein